MNHIRDLYSWSEQRREEAIRVTRRWPSIGGRGRRFEPARP